MVEASYVGNRGAWWEGNELINVNAISAERLATFGLSLDNADDRTLLVRHNGFHGCKDPYKSGHKASIQHPAVHRLPDRPNRRAIVAAVPAIRNHQL